MSIASRIEAIEQHLEDDYSVLEVAGADLTNVDKNIMNLKPTWQERLLYFINNGTEEVYNNWDKATGEGTEISLNNTLEAKMGIIYKGNTYQYSTTGKNLFDVTNKTQTTHSSGLTYKVENNIFTITGTDTSSSAYSLISWTNSQVQTHLDSIFQKGKTFTLSRTKYQDGFYFQINYFKEGASSQSSLVSYALANDKATFTIPQDFDHTGNVFLGVYASATSVNAEFSFQLEEGSSKTSFEPYTNGASPNPDYPQEIQVVSGDNTINVVGKNSLNNLTFEKGRLVNGVINYASNTTALTTDDNSISFTTNANYRGVSSDFIDIANFSSSTYIYFLWDSVSSSGFTVYCNYYDKDKTYISASSGYNLTSAKRYSNSVNNAKYIRMYVELNSSGSLTLTKPQVRFGNETPTDYQPYKGASYPINLPEGMELCKIGTYQDRIFKSSGKNLFNKSTITSSSYINTDGSIGTNANTFYSDYIKVNPNTKYTISGKNNAWGNTALYNASKQFIQRVEDGNLTTTSETYYIRTNGRLEYINEIQIEIGSQATPYEPYGTSWYLNKQIGKVVLNGSETWTRVNASGGNYRFRKSVNNIQQLSTAVGFSNYFINDGDSYSHQGLSGSTGANIYIRWDDLFTEVTDLTSWLSTHNTIVYYVLATPTYTEIEGTLKEQLEAIKTSYEGQTNISQENNNLASVLNASALQEM